MSPLTKILVPVAGSNVGITNEEGKPPSERLANGVVSPRTKQDRRKVEFWRRGDKEDNQTQNSSLKASSSPRTLEAKENAPAIQQAEASLPVSMSKDRTAFSRPARRQRRALQDGNNANNANGDLISDGNNCETQEIEIAQSVEFPHVLDTDCVLSPISQITEIRSPVVENAVDEVRRRPTVSRYPSIFEDYYYDDPSMDVEPENSIECSKSPIEEGEVSDKQVDVQQTRPLPKRQTTAEEQEIWGEFWTDGMRRKETIKRRNEERQALLQRVDTVKVKELLKNRLKH
ncbi:hypothetical protein FRB91_008192, partial [Serendipita sp. 411]